MKPLSLSSLALAVGLAFSAGAIAQGMSGHDFKAGKHRIAAEYKLAKSKCAALSGNPNDICEAEAKGRERVELAELEAAYKPTREHRYDARIARAEAAYAVAKEKCDDTAGNARDICQKQAKAAHIAARADAKSVLKAGDAQADANEKAAEAREDATADKMDADYATAKQKCDDLAGNAKEVCINRAKANFGQ